MNFFYILYLTCFVLFLYTATLFLAFWEILERVLLHIYIRFISQTSHGFSRSKQKQDTYEVDEKDPFYKKGQIGKSQHRKTKHLDNRMNTL